MLFHLINNYRKWGVILMLSFNKEKNSIFYYFLYKKFINCKRKLATFYWENFIYIYLNFHQQITIFHMKKIT